MAQRRQAACGGVLGVALALAVVAPLRAQNAAEEVLTLTPQNTVILDGSVYAGRTLQYYLIKCLHDPQVATQYALDAKGDRAAAPAFPLLREGGAVLPEGKNVIAVGDTRFLTAEDRARLTGEGRAALVRRMGRVIVIAGAPINGSWDGPYFSVAKFLDLCAGVRFYGPEDPWISTPKAKEIRVNELNYYRRWPFAGLEVGYEKRNVEWLRMNANRGTMRATHALAPIFNPSKYAKTHPEIYEMRRGERRIPTGLTWNPCLSAAALPDLAMEHVRERRKANPTLTYVSFGVQDCAFDCECPECQASVKRHNGSYSNLYYAFLNKVAQECRKEFPGLYLTAYVYSNVRTPPVGMRIESNIVVDCVIKSYRFVDPAWLEYEKGRSKAFSDLGASWAVHDWCFSDVSPRSYMRAYASFLQWAAQNGMVGAVVEISSEENWYLEGPKYWLLMQLMQDPYQDVDQLLRQYCDDLYGPASETMYRFFSHFEDKYRYATNYIELNDLPRQEPAMYSAEDLKHERELLEKALAQGGGEAVVRERLTKVMRYFISHELWAQAVYEPQRLFRQAAASGSNDALLAFYLNDDASKVRAAMDYYLTRRTLPPDSNVRNTQLGMYPSLIANYTRGKQKLLDDLRQKAMEAVDLSAADARAADAVAARCLAYLRAALPTACRKENVRQFESILGKSLFIPRAPALPAIDGDLSDPAWKNAAELKDFLTQDLLDVPVHETTGRIMRVGDSVAIALTCRQQGAIGVWTPRDSQAGSLSWKESGVEIFLGKVRERDEKFPYAQYLINANGAFQGYRLAKDNRAGVQVVSVLDREKGVFVIEAVLPLKAEGYDLSGEKALSFNIYRKANTLATAKSAEDLPPATSAWYPVFGNPHLYGSRGIVFIE
jgi:hypothetical protein